MGVAGGRAWPRRIAAGVKGLAVGMLVAATSLAPPPVDDAMVERAVAGAEWLAARAEETPERVDVAGDAMDLTNWLLVAGGAAGAERDAFAEHLGRIGYEDHRFVISVWLDEFSRILAAARAARRGAELRSLEQIQAEIRTLPTVPLDDAGEADRERLIEERDLAAVPSQERAAAATAAGRIEALRRLAGIGHEQ